MSSPLDLRRFRLRAVWLLIIPFYFYASPTTTLLLVGAVVSAAGLTLRAWAAGHIRKDRQLATTGPYAHLRDPLYLGSFFLGSGVMVGGGRWIFGVVFLVSFVLVYRATVVREISDLEALFGEPYRAYRARVPSVWPRLTPYQPEPSDSAPPAFSGARYMRNREWEAALGAVAAFGLLALKLQLWP